MRTLILLKMRNQIRYKYNSYHKNKMRPWPMVMMISIFCINLEKPNHYTLVYFVDLKFIIELLFHLRFVS